MCEFEWKKAHDAVRLQKCTADLRTRIKFVGDYGRHECAIEIKGAKNEVDAGAWECEMEDYVWGPARGATHKRSMELTFLSNEKGEEDLRPTNPKFQFPSTSTSTPAPTTSKFDTF